MTIDDFIERTRAAQAAQPGATTPSFLVYTAGTKEFFHGELVDTSSAESLLLRQADGDEVLILRRHIVAIMAARPDQELGVKG
ncbi:MAG TPA: hypothetical protein VHE35_34425 [Kofleriaceae bacterium]|nr:hypothetical protein [Kofleriaceae bacterium]